MSSELVNYGRNALSKTDSTLAQEAGSTLLKAGTATICLGLGAWVIPFISFPMLVILTVLLGAFLRLR